MVLIETNQLEYDPNLLDMNSRKSVQFTRV